MQSDDWLGSPPGQKRELRRDTPPSLPPRRVGAGEVLLQVAVHLPHAPEQVSEEWVVLGSQTLCALRDALYCVVDTNVRNMEREVRGPGHFTVHPCFLAR